MGVLGGGFPEIGEQMLDVLPEIDRFPVSFHPDAKPQLVLPAHCQTRRPASVGPELPRLMTLGCHTLNKSAPDIQV